MGWNQPPADCTLITGSCSALAVLKEISTLRSGCGGSVGRVLWPPAPFCWPARPPTGGSCVCGLGSPAQPSGQIRFCDTPGKKKKLLRTSSDTLVCMAVALVRCAAQFSLISHLDRNRMPRAIQHNSTSHVYSPVSCSNHLRVCTQLLLLLLPDPYHRYNMVAAALSQARVYAPANSARRAVQTHAAAPAKPSMKTTESERVCAPCCLRGVCAVVGCAGECALGPARHAAAQEQAVRTHRLGQHHIVVLRVSGMLGPRSS